MVMDDLSDWFDETTSDLKDNYSSLKEKMGRPGKDEILEGDIIPILFKLGWPIMIATFLRTLYNLVDTFWLGHLPKPENAYSVTAVGQAWTFVFLMMSVGIGFGVAALALVSQHTGQKNYEEASRDAGQLYFIAIVFSIGVGILGYFITPYFLDILVGTGPEAPKLAYYATQYLQVIFLGLPFMFLFFAFTFILRGWGDTITPMKITAIAVFLNLILDPILIFGSGPFPFFGFQIPEIPFLGPIPKMGIQGAAIATISTRGIGALYAMYILFSGKLGIEVKWSYLKPDFSKIKKFLTVGLPASFGRMGSAFGFILLWAIIYRLPNPEIIGAAYGVGNRILNITFLVMGGLAMAMSTMVGQSLGSDDVDRAEEVTKKGIFAMIILMTIFAIFIFLIRNLVIGAFITNPEVVLEGADFLMIFALAMPFFGIFRGITSILGGAGHTTQQMGLSLSRILLMRIPLVFVFAVILTMNATGVWLGMALSNVIAAGLALGVYSLGWWKEKIIEEGPTPGGPAIQVDDPKEEDEEE